MPFIIRSSQAKQLGILDWDEIDIGVIYQYRKEFKSRHNKLRDRGLDFTNETKSVPIDALRFNELIQSAEVGHYLVAQYMCQSEDRGFKGLTIGFCIRRKRVIGRDDTAKSKIYWPDGREVTTGDLKIGKESYLGRRARIFDDFHVPDFQSDREGRAHRITPMMKKVVQKMFEDNEVLQANGQKEYKPFYAYFILDTTLGQKTLSVAFAVSEITAELKTTKTDGEWVGDPPVAYDHGTACCPIG